MTPYKWSVVGAVVLAVPLVAAERLQMHVSQIAIGAAATVVVQVRVPADSDNRSLEVAVESPSFARRSEVPLNGADAPRVCPFEFRNLPSGDYRIRAILRGAGERERATAVESITLY